MLQSRNPAAYFHFNMVNHCNSFLIKTKMFLCKKKFPVEVRVFFKASKLCLGPSHPGYRLLFDWRWNSRYVTVGFRLHLMLSSGLYRAVPHYLIISTPGCLSIGTKFTFSAKCKLTGRSKWLCVGLRPLVCSDCGFESRSWEICFLSVLCVVG